MREVVDGPGQARCVTGNRRLYLPARGLHPQPSARPPREQAALDRPFDRVAGHPGCPQTQELDRTGDQRVVAHPDEPEGQHADRVDVGVAKGGAGQGTGHGNGSPRRHSPGVPGHHTAYLRVCVAKLEFSAEVTVKTTLQRAFDYFADHRHVAEVLEGVSRWEPIGTKTQGAGARFRVEMRALGLPLQNVLRLNRWRRPREIGWVSESGLIKQEGGSPSRRCPGACGSSSGSHTSRQLRCSGRRSRGAWISWSDDAWSRR